MPPKNMSKERIEAEKNTILEHALNIVGEEGYRSISMRKIGKSCNFSHAKIYYYFANKDEILLSLVDNGFSILKNKVVEECEKETNPKQKLITYLTEIYNFGIKKANYFNLMFGIEVPKYSDLLSKGKIEEIENLHAYKEKALEFYMYYTKVIKDYATTLNTTLTDDEVLNSFIQVSGIIWLENSKLLKEIDHDKDSLFESTVNNILHNLSNK